MPYKKYECYFSNALCEVCRYMKHIHFFEIAKILQVDDIAKLLNLTKCLDTRVSCISGGEKKRLSIGVELVTNPPIMFFDEPTR